MQWIHCLFFYPLNLSFTQDTFLKQWISTGSQENISFWFDCVSKRCTNKFQKIIFDSYSLRQLLLVHNILAQKFLREGFKKKIMWHLGFWLNLRWPLPRPPIWALLSGQFFLLFYLNLHPSKHDIVLWSTFSPSDMIEKLRTKLSNSIKNLEEFLWNWEVVRRGGCYKFFISMLFFRFCSN